MNYEARIEGLNLHPFKSARAIAVDKAVVSQIGLMHDRIFMAIKSLDGGESWQMMSQARAHPELARLETAIEGDDLKLGFDDYEHLVPLEGRTGITKEVKFYDQTIEGVDQGDEMAALIYKLVETYSNQTRATQYRVIRAMEDANFTDKFPIHLSTNPSLQALQGIMPKNQSGLPMRNFRANIEVNGELPAWVERQLIEARINDLILTGTEECDRCMTTHTDQATGDRGTYETTKVLRANQITVGVPVERDGNTKIMQKPVFGTYLRPENQGHMVVTVGDDVTLKCAA